MKIDSLWIVPLICLALSLVGFALALTIEPGAINMGAGCLIAGILWSAIILVVKR